MTMQKQIIESVSGKYRYKAYHGEPGVIVFVKDVDADIYVEKRLKRTISIENMSPIFEAIENGTLTQTTDELKHEITYWTGADYRFKNAESKVAKIINESNVKVEAELKAKTLPSGREDNLAAVRKMLGMASKNKARRQEQAQASSEIN